jgi:hypothetical protein
MSMFRFRPPLLALALGVSVLATSGSAQTTPEEAGFLAKLPSTATGQEMTEQSNLWVMEVRLKPMRMVTANITDPKTGEQKRTLVWYVVYQAVNRPLTGPTNVRDTVPVNEFDPPPGPPQFVPAFTLVTNDNGNVRVYEDEVLPEAIAAIEKRERRPYPNGVRVVGDVPEAIPYDAENEPREQIIEGIATFRGIDPETDYFTLLGTGFSNGYKMGDRPGGGEPLVWRKTLVQKYWRPGDRFEQNEGEFRFRGEPTWTFRPDEVEDPLVGIEEPPAEPATPDE